MSMPGPPHSEPPRWPGQTSMSSGERQQPARAASGRCRARPRASPPPGRGGRRRPRTALSPVRTAQGSSPRVRSISANAVCSGRCPGVWIARTEQRAELELVVVIERARARSSRAAARCTWIIAPVAAARRPCPDTWSAWLWVSSTWSMSTAQVAGQLEVGVDLEARVDDRRHPGVLVAHEVRGAAEVVVHDLAEDHSRTLSPCPRATRACRRTSRCPRTTARRTTSRGWRCRRSACRPRPARTSI